MVEDDQAHRNSGGGTFVLHEPSEHESCFVRYGKKDRLLYVHTKTLVKYLTDRQLLKKDMINKLEPEGIFVRKNEKSTHRINLSKGTERVETIMETYVFNWENDAIPDLIPDKETTEEHTSTVAH